LASLNKIYLSTFWLWLTSVKVTDKDLKAFLHIPGP